MLITEFELDVGLLQRLLQAQRVPGALADHLLARAQQAAQLLGLPVRHEARPDHAMRFQIAQPVAIAHVALVARQVLHVRRIGQHQLPLAVVQDVPHRLPVHPRRLHHDVGHVMAIQPFAQRQKIGRRRLEGSNLLLDTPVPGKPDAGHDRLLVNIEACTTLMKHFHRCLLQLCRRNGSPFQEI